VNIGYPPILNKIDAVRLAWKPQRRRACRAKGKQTIRNRQR